MPLSLIFSVTTEKVNTECEQGYIHNYWRHWKFHVSCSGDHDMCVPFTGSQAWTRSIGYKIVDEWRPWLSNGQVVGYLFLLILSYLMNFHFQIFWSVKWKDFVWIYGIDQRMVYKRKIKLSTPCIMKDIRFGTHFLVLVYLS
jgi:hypothetical protein